MTDTKFVYVTYITTTPEKIWEALTTTEITRRYWGNANVSDWKPGSKWQHVRDDDARSVAVMGEVVESVRPRRLVMTWSDPADFADRSKHSRVTFELETLKDVVKLTVTHDELASGSDMARNIAIGWPLVLSSLKSYLETDRALDIRALKACKAG
jgi:uncharacterized protein YndB with AHSA1/START domain